ncbi:4-(cytidine 5'-diphospho)-2-C-methyl-D-erythritol kinase, partial [Pantoea eucalypti]
MTGRRPDGYHNLQTLFQYLDYGDQLQSTVDDSDSIQLVTPVAGVADAATLMVRAANRLKQAALTKHCLPARAGAQIA